jgi:phosphoglycerate dehydrogenase-like enzyme
VATPRAVVAYHPSLGSTRGRPISEAHQSRIDAIASSERVEFVIEPNPEKIVAAAEGADFFLTKNAPLPEGLLERAKRLRLIQVATLYGEKVDIDAAAAAGVPVSFCDRPIVNSVADHSMALLLEMVRSIPAAIQAAREGTGRPPQPPPPPRRA